MQLSDINFAIGSVNPSGIKDEVFMASKKDISAWPSITDDFDSATEMDDYTVLDGNFTLVSGKTWIRLYTTQGKGKISAESTGETDCKMFLNKASLSYPRITNEARGFAKCAANGDFVFIVKHDGKYFVIGSQDYRATVSPSMDSGDSAGSAKGLTIEIECPDVTPLPVYEGTLALSDGSLNCSTGAFTPTASGGGTGNGDQ